MRKLIVMLLGLMIACGSGTGTDDGSNSGSGGHPSSGGGGSVNPPVPGSTGGFSGSGGSDNSGGFAGSPGTGGSGGSNAGGSGGSGNSGGSGGSLGGSGGSGGTGGCSTDCPDASSDDGGSGDGASPDASDPDSGVVADGGSDATTDSGSSSDGGLGSDATTDGGRSKCVLTQGYWANHPDLWTKTSLLLGNTIYTETQCLGFLTNPVNGDASLILAEQLITSLLNGMDSGSVPNPSYPQALVMQAEQWMRDNGVVLPYHVDATSPSGMVATGIASQLDQFNNGKLAGYPACQ